jgi:hypothetical protein
MQKDIDTLFGHLWDNYIQVTPSAHKVHQLLGGGAPIINDHVAFRTYNLPKLGLEKLAAHFRALGTKRRASMCSRPRSSMPNTSSIKILMRPRCSSAS